MKIIEIILVAAFIALSSVNAKSDEISNKLLESVNLLNRLYYNEIENCEIAPELQNLSTIYCSGVIVHGQETGEVHIWVPDQKDPRKAVSFSYIRHDIPSKLLYNPSGFIYNQYEENSKMQLNYYCIYPFDAITIDTRYHPSSSHGCGMVGNLPKEETFASCPSISITTANQFIEQYLKNGNPKKFLPESCSFDARKTEGFQASIGAQINTNSPYWNELITNTWTEDEAANLPIAAFFYLAGSDIGRKAAFQFQSDYCNMYKKFIPVVSLDLTKRESGAFKGNRDEQQPCT